MTEPLLQLAIHAPAGRRRGRGALVALVALVAAAAGALVALGTTHGTDAATAAAEAPDAAPSTPSSSASTPVSAARRADALPAAGPAALQPLGAAAGLELAVPARSPVTVAYHEASFPEALPIAPAGLAVGNQNPTRSYDAAGGPGPDHHVQVSRGRVQGPTTAVDVVVAEGEAVLAPVAGTVTVVRHYELYDTHEDVRVEIVPDDDPALRVVLIHLDRVRVAVGDRVTVGDVLAEEARLFPFEAVVDRLTAPARHGHVHLEVKTPTPAADGSPSAVEVDDSAAG